MEQYTITSPFKHEETFFSQFETEDKYISKDDCKQVYSMMILDMWICTLTHTHKKWHPLSNFVIDIHLSCDRHWHK